jgi:Flp pilus assembly protein TadG
MKNQKKSLRYWIARRIKTSPAQSMVEFALALPVLLLATFGVIDFGRLMQAWLALENGARFGVRYAVTGEFNPKYCPAAYDALATDLGLTGNNGRDDCKVDPPGTDPTEAQRKEARDASQALEDWARLPSIREASINGASGIAYDKAVAGEDDYLAYLTDSSATFPSTDLGDPSRPGFVLVSICSSRDKDGTRFYTISSNSSHKYYYGSFTDDDHLYFPSICALGNPPPLAYMDDAGGPGDTVQVNITYRHNMITPLISDWWPSLRLNTSRKGIVEKFRTSRITGLSDTESEMGYQTETNTRTYTLTNTITLTPTITPTNTATFTDTPTVTKSNTPTKTNTLPPCTDTGTGLRSEFFNWVDTSTAPISPIPLAPAYIGTVETVDKNFGYNSPATGVDSDHFAARYSGFIYPPDTGDYVFRVQSDDGSVLRINNNIVINEWQPWSVRNVTSTPVALTRCQKYPITLEMMDGSGGSYIYLKWDSPSGSEEIIPKKYLFPNTDPISTASPTPTASNTPTVTPSLAPCPATGNGLRGQYYNYTEKAPPKNVFNGAPLVIQTDQTINFSWGSGVPIFNGPITNNKFAVRWIGQVMPLASEEYTFYTDTDDGVRLSVGGHQLFDGWTNTTHSERGTITLNRCVKYDIQMDYFDGNGSASAYLRWSSNRQSYEIIPMVNLFSDNSGVPSTATLTPSNTPITPPPPPSNTPVTPTTKVPPTVATTAVPTVATTAVTPPTSVPVPSSTPETIVPTVPTLPPTKTFTPSPRPTNNCGGAEGC